MQFRARGTPSPQAAPPGGRPAPAGGRPPPPRTRDPGRQAGQQVRIVRVPVGSRAQDMQVAADTAPISSHTMLAAEVSEETALVDAKAAGKALSDCAWCQYGKPAVAGAVAGGVLGYLVGVEPAKMALYGVGAGLAYGWYRG